MNNIKTVIFDIGNVLMSFDWKEYIERLYGKEEMEILAEAMFGDRRWDQFDLGIKSDEEIMQSFIRQAPDHEEQIRYSYLHIAECMSKRDYAADWIDEVKALGYRTLFLSNYSKGVMEAKPEVLYFLDRLDGGVFSCDVHLVKPDPAIYRYICDKYDLVPQECFFIDDNKDNIEAARKFGIQAYRFKDYETSVPEIMKLLKE